MAVIIGSARSDENGRITGGKAGDQKGGREVSTQEYYTHAKGWRVLRPKDGGKALKIADAMKKACANNSIGYDQNQRNTLYSNVKEFAFDPSKTTKAVETDCSALVRVCCAYAGIVMSDFNTSTEASRLLGSGAFTELTDSKYTRQSDYLKRGDILVTKTKGHTVVVLTSGAKAGQDDPIKPPELGDRILRNGCEGADVKELQSMLIQLDYDCGRWGADGDYGDATEAAVRNFQRDHALTIDGEAGPLTIAAVEREIGLSEDADDAEYVQIIGGNCYVRDQPSTNGSILGVAACGEVYKRVGESANGWQEIIWRYDHAAWVSGKYAKKVSKA